MIWFTIKIYFRNWNYMYQTNAYFIIKMIIDKYIVEQNWYIVACQAARYRWYFMWNLPNPMFKCNLLTSNNWSLTVITLPDSSRGGSLETPQPWDNIYHFYIVVTWLFSIHIGSRLKCYVKKTAWAKCTSHILEMGPYRIWNCSIKIEPLT